LQLKVSGGAGGHSSLVVASKIVNANKELAYLLYRLNKKYHINLISFNGGNIVNAIPTTAVATFSFNKDFYSSLIKDLDYFNEEIKKIYLCDNKEINVTFHLIDKVAQTMSDECTNQVISAINTSLNGMLYYNFEYNLPESSTNIGIVNSNQEQVNLEYMIRSPYKAFTERMLYSICNSLENNGFA